MIFYVKIKRKYSDWEIKMRKIVLLIIFGIIFLFSVSSAQTYTITKLSSDVFFGRPVDPDKYILGVGDKLRVYILKETGEPDIYELFVSPTGAINLLVAGSIKVAGLTLSEASKEVSRKILAYYPRSRVELELIFPRYMKISITGEVMNPGSYLVSALSTLDDVIKTAGGLKSSASTRNIEIKRGNSVISIDYLKYVKFGDEKGNLDIREGDTIYVPIVKKIVKVFGEVQNPGMVEIKEGETLRDVINIVSGFTPKADLFSAYVERQGKDKKEIIPVNLYKLIYEKDDKENIVLNEGDTLVVPERANRVYVLGYVQNPKSFIIRESTSEKATYTSQIPEEISENTKVSELIRMAGGILTAGSQRRVQVIRDNKLIKEIDLFKVLIKGDTEEENIKIVPGDMIYVPLKEKTVRVLGEVKVPGMYEVKAGEKIVDLIEMAGGFTVRADIKNVVIERYITEKKQIINLDLSKYYKDKDESVNILLEDGDVINIPVKSD